MPIIRLNKLIFGKESTVHFREVNEKYTVLFSALE